VALQVVSEELGHRLETVTADMLGSAKKVSSRKPAWHGLVTPLFLKWARFHCFAGLCILRLKPWNVDEAHGLLFDGMLIFERACPEGWRESSQRMLALLDQTQSGYGLLLFFAVE
jgi:hypothetical protein